MVDGAVALALGAGMLAALNPCGFALLPAYLTLLITDDQPSRTVAVRRAVTMSAAMTAGFATVFAIFGLLVAPLASSVQRYLPWFAIVVGVALLAAGGWLIAGRSLVLPSVGSRKAKPLTRSARSMFGFGVTYAVASLSCTIAPFLAVVVSSFRADSVAAGVVLFAAYALGMGLVVGTAAVAVALAQSSVVNRLRWMGGLIPRATGVLLVLVGAWVAYYGWWEVRVLQGDLTEDPVVEVAAGIQQWLANTVSDLGPQGFVIILGVLLVLVVVTARTHRRRGLGKSQLTDVERFGATQKKP